MRAVDLTSSAPGVQPRTGPWLARRASGWTVIAVIAAQLVFDPFFNFIVFPGHWFTPLYHATGGLFNSTLSANLIMLALVVGGLIVLAGNLRPSDVGLETARILPAVVFTICLWAIANVAVAAYTFSKGIPFALADEWSKPGPGPTIGAFIGQIFGNSLYEEIVYRGFLTVQLMLLLQSFGRTQSVCIAVAAAQAVFAVIHVPMLLVHGVQWAQMGPDILTVYLTGLGFAAVYLSTNNLFIAVGVHALADEYMFIARDVLPIPESTGHLGFSGVYIGLALLAAVLWRLSRSARAKQRQPHAP